MRRVHVHSLFGIAAALLLLMILWLSFAEHRLQTENRVLAQIQSGSSASQARGILETAGESSEKVRLAIASALASDGQLEQAENILNEIITTARSTELTTAARFNLGNAYMRQGVGDGVPISSQAIPLIELAKQHYRDLLEVEPGFWPARFNLARALLLVPEAADNDDSRNEPVKRVNVIVPGFQVKELP